MRRTLSRFPQSNVAFPRSTGRRRRRSVPQMDEEVRCEHCGDVIGVYEPLVAIVDGEAVHTSRAALAGAPVRGPHFHGSCFKRTRSAGEDARPAG